MQKFEESFDGTYHSSNKKTQPKKTKIIINVAETQYAVIKHVTKKLKWNLMAEPISNLNFDICWIDGHVRQQYFARMQSHQKINHFPGMGILSRKNNLGKNLMTFRKKFPSDYQFFPITWNLPSEYAQLQAYHQCRQKGKAQTFIVKPEASCQGRGIFLTRNVQKLKDDKYVVQRYMHKPYLVDGLKFDLRIYVLVTGIDPLRIFVYEEGLARFATQPYKPPRSQNLQNRFMHLTNYAINKQSPDFVFNQSSTEMDIGHKRSLTSIYKKIAEQGHNVEQLKQRIYDIIIKTMITGYPTLSSSYLSSHSQNFGNDMCFEILGFDVMLDYKLNPYLIEINYTPSFTTDTPLDRHIKKNLIHDSLNLLNITDKWKRQMKSKREKQIQERMVTGKRKKYNNQQRKNYMNEEARKRDLYESENFGQFTKIFMIHQEQMNEYRKYYDFSFQVYNNNSINSLSSINPFSPATQYPFYKHYFDDYAKKPEMTATTFSKTKKLNGNKQKNTLKVIQLTNKSKLIEKQNKASREQMTGMSQTRRISSAKMKKQKSQQKNIAYQRTNNNQSQAANSQQRDKKSIQNISSKNSEDAVSRMRDETDLCMQNESLFQNKILENVGVLRKRRSQLYLKQMSHDNEGD